MSANGSKVVGTEVLPKVEPYFKRGFNNSGSSVGDLQMEIVMVNRRYRSQISLSPNQPNSTVEISHFTSQKM